MTNPVAQKVSLSAIRLDPTLDRSHFDAAKLAELAQSMKEHGLMNPLSVRLLKGEEGREKGETPLTRPPSPIGGAQYEIIAGNRRFKAAQSLGWTEIDARVYPAETSETETELLALIDNLQRDDLNPMDQARAYARLTRAPHDMSLRDIATQVGKSHTAVSACVSLLELPIEVQKLASQLAISATHAQVLLKIRNDSTKVKFAKLAAEKGWTVRELEQRIDQWKGEAKSGSVRESGDHRTPMADPFAKLWEPLMLDGGIGAMGSWSVTFDAEPVPAWDFRVIATNVFAKEDLARWFLAMGLALGGEGSTPAATEPAKARRFDAPVSGDKLEEEVRHIRKPTTVADEELVTHAALKGPEALYALLYGAESDLAKSMRGKTWKDYGVDDPAAKAKEIIEALKVIP